MSALSAFSPKKKGACGSIDTMWADGAAMVELLNGCALALMDEKADVLRFSVAKANIEWQIIFQHCREHIPKQAAAGGTLVTIEGAAKQPEAS